MINFNGTGYTESEIITMYKQAKNRSLQIKIIADLLVTTQSEVKEYLAGKGLIKATALSKKKRRLNKSKIFVSFIIPAISKQITNSPPPGRAYLPQARRTEEWSPQ